MFLSLSKDLHFEQRLREVQLQGLDFFKNNYYTTNGKITVILRSESAEELRHTKVLFGEIYSDVCYLADFLVQSNLQ